MSSFEAPFDLTARFIETEVDTLKDLKLRMEELGADSAAEEYGEYIDWVARDPHAYFDFIGSVNRAGIKAQELFGKKGE